MLEVGDGATSRREYNVDASTGSVLAAYDLVRTELPEGDGEAATITGNGLAREGGDVVAVTGWHHLDTGDHYLHGEELAWSVHEPGDDCFTAGDITHRSGADWGSSDPAALSVAFNLEQTIAYFDDTHAFTGWDGEGGHTVAIVRYACYQPNAFYIGDGLIAFGVGGGPLFDLGVADVVAHEFTHAVTGSTANLVYQGEPGALNESFSDIFGSAFELGSQVDNRAAYPATAPGTADWLIAEDAGTAPLRDMRNPGSMSVLTPSPSRYEGTLWKDPTDIDFDYGGVHFNSGVQNHFFYLLAEGGAGTNDGIAYELDALGLDSAASIAFRALAHYTHADSDYAEIREAWLSAAFDLQHLDPERDWVAAVDSAWTAVGVTTDFCPSWHRDGDGDGFGDPDQTMAACSRPDGWVADATDCDDGDVRVFPDASEVCDDGVLNACTPPDDVCGEVEIAVAPPNVSVTWQSDCVLQTADEVAGPFFDYAGAVTQNGCDREALFSTAAPMQFFRLRTP
jgi:Zn-dependent metalloprotease